ncbi:PREDICTED: LOW QUALITY PROTEIN: leucine-rich repeat-containing protein 46 [Pseudopodoces humilis]|uniref:LOW QUALITY PROTEIN: leucine-rich repeat-containing protein 46 n=1 Tax=Pseudopodoces humilis TaxID=181119 RepID=UPI0006B81ECB|nr:PREDICTED: LOW QUALITY PROTEIN: leucine-rich repeat-containing protein 46 [Pseudopodoces humilis]
MAEQGDSPCGAPEGTRPGVTLSDSLVTTRTCPTGPLPTSTLRLDRENISCIGKLRRMAEIHSLYLQQNQIEKIENLESFPSLRFLCLAGNRIQRVENLQALPHLSALDLSHNQIRALDAEELPRSLRILDLTGNECSRQDGYRDLVVAALPHLLQLDSQPIHGDTAREEAGGGSCSSSSEEEEEEEEDEELFPELRIPFTVDKGARTGTGRAALLVWQCHISWDSRPGRFPAGWHRELAGRARWRRRKSLEEHRARLEELREPWPPLQGKLVAGTHGGSQEGSGWDSGNVLGLWECFVIPYP